MKSLESALIRGKETGSLNLSQRDLNEIPFQLIQFDTLKFENARWWEFVNISKLDISLNSISIIPEDLFLGNLNDLTHLNISHNCLRNLPESLKKLKLLKQINVSNNQLQALPNLASFKHLVEIRMSNNTINSLDLSDCDALQALYADHNKLERLYKLPDSLRILDVSANIITDIANDFLSKDSELRTFNLSDNKLKQLPHVIGNLRKLSELDISKNEISILISFKETSLHSLSASHNMIKMIDAFPYLLSTVLLDNNKLTDFPKALLALEQLVTLDLRNNDL